MLPGIEISSRVGDQLFVIVQAARETGALKEAKDKLEKRVEELTWRLQLEKRLRVNLLECPWIKN